MSLWRGWRLLVVAWLLAASCLTGRAQGIDVTHLALSRQDSALMLEFALKTQLSRSVEDALQRGVPMYFTAQATLLRTRWFWRDERLARVTRQWRLAYQPLTSTWRVGIGGLTQSYGSLQEAMAMITRTAGWHLADLGQLDPDSRHYVEFSFRLDTSQLPPPMLVGLTSQGGWQLSVERTLRVD